MLEILVLITLSKRIAAKARDKGYSGTPYVVMLLLLWIGGEIGGAIAGALVSVEVMGDIEPNMVLVYLGGIGCAIVGAILSFVIVGQLKQLRPVRDEFEDDRDHY